MLTRRAVLLLAGPIVLAQAATAMTGVVDTAVMGRVGSDVDLAAVAMASVTFSFIYWGFGFLRMATTGQTAQAVGAGEASEAQDILRRALLLGGTLGLALMVMLPVIEGVALGLFSGSDSAERLVSAYMWARIGGAPAALMGFAILGWMLGMGRTRELLVFQVVLNGTNAVLDSLFVGAFEWGPAGIGVGTAIAEWVALFVGLFMVWDVLRWSPGILDAERLRSMFVANRDIMIRTLALLAGFAWFVNAGARQGDAVAAGNQVLLQFIAVSAFVLDAFAFVAEKEAGEAVGAGDADRLRQAIRITSELALGFGAVFAAGFAVLGSPIIEAFVSDDAARAVALEFLPYCALVPLIGVPAWQLDGIFLGATQGRVLRNAAVVATLAYVCLDLSMRGAGNQGVWVAFLTMYIFRAISLGFGLPGLLRIG